jgi:hypothetical protein
MRILSNVIVKFRQIISALKFGGILRILSIYIERYQKGYSTRSISYSLPKAVRIFHNTKYRIEKIYFIPHLSLKFAYAGLKSILEFIEKDLKKGRDVKIVLHDFPGNLEAFAHILKISPSALVEYKKLICLVDCSTQSEIKIHTHPDSEFIATAWWTKYSIDNAVPPIPKEKVTYLIQDYEVLFYESSDSLECQLKKMAALTYQNVENALINSSFLKNYLVKENILNANKIELFEPLIDKNIFFEDKNVKKKKQIFIYSRPEVKRNRFDICIEILNTVSTFIPNDWEIIGLGTLKKDWKLSSNKILKAKSKLDFDEYVNFLKITPVSLCLMESPHPSHPPLEHALCGGLVVCNNFPHKDFQNLGSNFICADLDVEELGKKLLWAIEQASLR